MIDSPLSQTVLLLQTMRAYLTLALILSLAPIAAAEESATPSTVTKNPPSAEDIEALANAKANFEAQGRLYHSRNAFARLVRDVATWDFAAIPRNSNWVIAEIKPPTGPTFWHVRSGESAPVINGLPSIPMAWTEGAQTNMVWEGTVKVLTPLGIYPLELARVKPISTYRYDRTIWIGKGGEGLTVADEIGTEGREAYSPFRHGPVDGQTRNLALCSIPESIQNAEIPNTGSTLKPNPYLAHIISEEMLQWVVPAQTFYIANPTLFSPENAPANRTQLLELLDNENPFLFAAAVRTLAQSGQMGKNFASSKLLKADRFRQAVFVYSVLFYSPEEQGRDTVHYILQTIEQPFGKQIRRGPRIAPFEGLIIGAFCAFQETTNPRLRLEYAAPNNIVGVRIPTSPSLRLYRPLIVALTKNQIEFGVTTDTDRYLQSIMMTAHG